MRRAGPRRAGPPLASGDTFAPPSEIANYLISGGGGGQHSRNTDALRGEGAVPAPTRAARAVQAGELLQNMNSLIN